MSSSLASENFSNHRNRNCRAVLEYRLSRPHILEVDLGPLWKQVPSSSWKHNVHE